MYGRGSRLGGMEGAGPWRGAVRSGGGRARSPQIIKVNTKQRAKPITGIGKCFKKLIHDPSCTAPRPREQTKAENSQHVFQMKRAPRLIGRLMVRNLLAYHRQSRKRRTFHAQRQSPRIADHIRVIMTSPPFAQVWPLRAARRIRLRPGRFAHNQVNSGHLEGETPTLSGGQFPTPDRASGNFVTPATVLSGSVINRLGSLRRRRITSAPGAVRSFFKGGPP